MKYFDAHSHIHEKEFDADRSEMLGRMREAGVSTITVGTHLDSSRKAVELADKEPDVWATVGLHPTDTREKFDEEDYRKLVENKKVVAIGECGLDYYWIDEGETEIEKGRQMQLFVRQINLAAECNKPLMLHGRPSKGTMDAYEDMLVFLEPTKKIWGQNLRGNIHFFVGSKEIAERFLNLGFTMSFTGVITFTHDYDEVIKYIPLESILSETDCPYVTPVPYRGKRNEPTYVIEAVKAISRIKNLPLGTVSESLFANTYRVFGLK